MPPERRTVYYAGRVQGVGFRWMTARALEDLPLTGFVRNLRDGRVQLVLEGALADVDNAIRRVREAMKAYIQAEEQERGPATGEFQEFRIAR